MQGNNRKSGAWSLIPLALAVVIVLGGLLDSGASTAQFSRRFQSIQDLARSYIDSGYAVVGPIGVVAINAETLTLRNPYKDMTLSIRGQTVVVMGSDARPLSRSALVTGSNVYVCRKGSETAVILLP
jgi:hypothetical protein